MPTTFNLVASIIATVLLPAVGVLIGVIFNNLRNYKKDRDAHEKDMYLQKTKQTELEKDIKSLNETVKTQTSDIKTLTEKVEKQKKTIETQAETIKTQTSDIEKLTEKVENQKKTIETQAETIKTQTSDIKTLTEKVETFKKQVETLTAENAKLKTQPEAEGEASHE